MRQLQFRGITGILGDETLLQLVALSALLSEVFQIGSRLGKRDRAYEMLMCLSLHKNVCKHET